MIAHALQRWQRTFREAAEADGCAIFREHLSRLNLPGKPELLLEGTILAVQACAAYASVDGQPAVFAEFVAMQRYDPREVPAAKYAFTFDLCGKAYARLLVAAKSAIPDLADLHDHPWDEYRLAGYNELWISRNDCRPLTRREVARLEREVTEDLRFDYSEDVLDFWFDDSSRKDALRVYLNDLPQGGTSRTRRTGASRQRGN
jgi:hypothetical protein